MATSQIEVAPISGALGAEIHGVNLASELDDGTIADIRTALLENLVIFFRDQDLTPEKQLAFARRFGEPELHDFVEGMPDHPEVIAIIKDADDAGYNFGGRWHTDVSYQERPALGSILYAVDAPPRGGDTLFANQYLAYETLSEGMRKLLDPLKAVHSAAGSYGPDGRAAKLGGNGYTRSMHVNPSDKAQEEMLHPVVRTHPESGRKGLYVNEVYTERFEGMTVEESRPWLEYLFRRATFEPFTCRFRWETGSVAFWDNRCVQHYALNDYSGFRREMHRVTLGGDRPA